MIRELKARGVGIIYIPHKMDELKQISDRVTVLRDGEYVATAPTAGTAIETIIGMMVGRTLSDERVAGVAPAGDIALEVRHLNCGPLVRDVSFSLRKGEILGYAGLMGAGRTEVARAIFGADALQSGDILVNGRKVSIRTPRHAVANGIGYLSEDRKRFGLATGMDVESNVVMYDHARHAPLGDVITLDFINTALEPGARVGIELRLETAKELRAALDQAIAAAELDEAEVGGKGAVPRSAFLWFESYQAASASL
jgi:ribose transport system ATP-binding protein